MITTRQNLKACTAQTRREQRTAEAKGLRPVPTETVSTGPELDRRDTHRASNEF
jgi:hypothetical protein